MPRFSNERPLAEPDQVFVGSGDGVYEELQPRGGLADDFFSVGRGVALGDIDGDGDVDVVLQDNSASVRILRNVAPKAGGWIMLDVRTKNGTQALGAQAKLTQGDRVQVRQVQSADSYCSSSDPRVHFGLGAASGDLQVEITWLDGTQENFDGLTEGTSPSNHARPRALGPSPRESFVQLLSPGQHHAILNTSHERIPPRPSPAPPSQSQVRRRTRPDPRNTTLP